MPHLDSNIPSYRLWNFQVYQNYIRQKYLCNTFQSSFECRNKKINLDQYNIYVELNIWQTFPCLHVTFLQTAANFIQLFFHFLGLELHLCMFACCIFYFCVLFLACLFVWLSCYDCFCVICLCFYVFALIYVSMGWHLETDIALHSIVLFIYFVLLFNWLLVDTCIVMYIFLHFYICSDNG